MTAESIEYGRALIPRPEKSFKALRQALAQVAPYLLAEMEQARDAADTKALEFGSLNPLRSFLMHWAAIVEIERHPDLSREYFRAERIETTSGDPAVARRGVRVSGEIYRAAFKAANE